jgi:hypothetical protein
MRTLPPRRELPIVFRPCAAELLSSWICRIAGTYHLDASTLLADYPSLTRDLVSEIDVAPSLAVLTTIGELTRTNDRGTPFEPSRFVITANRYDAHGQC